MPRFQNFFRPYRNYSYSYHSCLILFRFSTGMLSFTYIFDVSIFVVRKSTNPSAAFVIGSRCCCGFNSFHKNLPDFDQESKENKKQPDNNYLLESNHSSSSLSIRASVGRSSANSGSLSIRASVDKSSTSSGSLSTLSSLDKSSTS